MDPRRSRATSAGRGRAAREWWPGSCENEVAPLGRGLTEPMRLYLVRGDLAFNSLRLVPEGEWPCRAGVPVSQPWRPLELMQSGSDGAALILVDCFALNTGADGFVISDYAHSRLAEPLSAAGEFWPVSIEGRRYWWFNCLACVEVLDRQATDADWSTVSGVWGSFRWITSTRRLAFMPAGLVDAPVVFRVPEYPQAVLFAGDTLVRAVTEWQLTGFQLDLVWSSQDGGRLDPPGVSLGGVFETAASDAGSADIARRRESAAAALERRGHAGAPDGET